MKNLLSLLCLLCICFGCSKTNTHKKVGVDSSWFAANFGAMTSSVNGFVEDLLIEIAQLEEIEFKKVPANPDTLYAGLDNHSYDVVLSTLPMYSYNCAKYDFSSAILPSGFVLIVPKNSPIKSIKKLENQTVGFVMGEMVVDFIDEKPFLRRKNYLTERQLLEGLSIGEVSCAVASFVKVKKIVNDLYEDELKIITPAFSNDAIRFIGKKDSQKEFLEIFDKALDTLHRNKRIKALEEKWGL